MFKVRNGEELILASASPRRKELLRGIGLQFDVCSADIDETPRTSESPEEMVLRLAAEKAETIAAGHPSAWILAADTTVVLDGEILGKPLDKSDAIRMLRLLQGRRHQVLGGVTLLNLAKRVSRSELMVSMVKIMPLNTTLIENYVDSGEPMDKAGSYAIQGIGAGLVEEVTGSYTNVVGLNLAAVIGWLSEYNILER